VGFPWLLDIQFVNSDPQPYEGERIWKAVRGGPDHLIGWLETQLGLLRAPLPRSTRILRYSALLSAQKNPIYLDSLRVDRWMTASELLRRRDELRSAGWPGRKSEGLPRLVGDLAEIEEAARKIGGHHADRIDAILESLDGGQKLPEHQVILRDPPEVWDPKFRELLARMTTVPAEARSPNAPKGSSLLKAQTGVLSGKGEPFAPDASLRWIRFGSRHSAAEAIAAALKGLQCPLSSVAVLAEDEAAAIQVDEALLHLGLPTMGVKCGGRALPALQILPLVTALLLDPVDPRLLLDLLSLPIGPIPRRVSWPLARALEKEPGLGSDAWNAAVEILTSEAKDPEQANRKVITKWFGGKRIRRGEAIPTKLLAEQCGLLSQWAAGRATLLGDSDDPEEQELASPLSQVASHASALGEIAGALGETVSEPQLARLLEDVLAEGSLFSVQPQAAGGPRRVSSLAELGASVSHLVWLGLGTSSGPQCPWTKSELESLRNAGFDVDDGGRYVAGLRQAERRGLSMLGRSLLAVGLPGDRDLRPHPVWLQVLQGLRLGGTEDPLNASDLLAGRTKGDTSPWVFPTASSEIIPPPPKRSLWRIDRGLLVEPETRSAASLVDRLGCPLKWVFRYQAELYKSPIANLPSSFRLSGNLCHKVLQTVFSKKGGLPTTERGQELVAQCFDESLPRNAAPLAEPEMLPEARQLRQQLLRSTEVLLNSLRRGGYEFVEMEGAFDLDLNGKRTEGRLDCLVRDAQGNEGVIDFKYAGAGKHRGLLESGRALQLAVYAASRQASAKKRPAIAYLILERGLLLTPKSDALVGTTGPGLVPSALPISEVWTKFLAALEAADGWMTKGELVPARPLQEEVVLPAGYELIKNPNAAKDSDPEPCHYCDYGVLCGRRGLR
jgi:ATP-dependent helicase/nuclease subunit B